MNLTTVRVDFSVRGAWEVALSDLGERVTCETLEEASRVAYRCAADRRPSELIVCDAYHRVVHHELIDGREGRRRAPLRACLSLGAVGAARASRLSPLGCFGFEPSSRSCPATRPRPVVAIGAQTSPRG